MAKRTQALTSSSSSASVTSLDNSTNNVVEDLSRVLNDTDKDANDTDKNASSSDDNETEYFVSLPLEALEYKRNNDHNGFVKDDATKKHPGPDEYNDYVI